MCLRRMFRFEWSNYPGQANCCVIATPLVVVVVLMSLTLSLTLSVNCLIFIMANSLDSVAFSGYILPHISGMSIFR